MADRPDLRQIAVNITEALESYDREQLAQMLTYVFKEYVVEGPPSVLISQVDGIEALSNLNFAELIEQLQARLDVPELETLRSARWPSIGSSGRCDDADRCRACPSTRCTVQSSCRRRHRLGKLRSQCRNRILWTSEAASRIWRSTWFRPGDCPRGFPSRSRRPGWRTAGNHQRTCTSRGLSINSRPSATGGAGVAPAQPAASTTSTTPTTTPTSKQTDPPKDSDDTNDGKPPAGDDDASVRFSLLELD